MNIDHHDNISRERKRRRTRKKNKKTDEHLNVPFDNHSVEDSAEEGENPRPSALVGSQSPSVVPSNHSDNERDEESDTAEPPCVKR
jgi:hypothetical protein